MTMQQKVLVMLIALVLAACEPAVPSKAAAGTPQSLSTQSLMLVGGPSATTLSLTVEIADDAAEQEQGLMFRPRLPDNYGMLFVWPAAQRNVFWMKNTPEPLDLLFFDNGRLVATIAYAKPFDETPLDPGVASDWVLEMPAGFAAAHQLLPNQRWQGQLLPKPE